MIENISLSNITQTSNIAQPITIITGLKYNTNLMKVFNNITFVYDPNWEYQQGEPTYPIAFFYVKNMSEQMSSDVSKRPMLFYNTAGDTNDATKGGLMNIVADNIVLQPKIYKLDVIIPANGSTFKNSSFSFDSMALANSFIYSNGEIKGNVGLDVASRMVNTSLSILETMLKGLYGTEISVSSICNMLLQQQDYNKASVEYMWANRRIIKLKLWNGWRFKYLVIKDLEINKKGEDGDFYEGSITCQEVPILTFRKQSKTSLSSLSKFSNALGKAQKKMVDGFIKAMTSTYNDGET